MSKQQREKISASATTPEKNLPEKPFAQVEGKLTEAQLEAIAGGLVGGCTPPRCVLNHNETMVSSTQPNS